MLTKLYAYLKKYKDEKIQVTKDSALFQHSITIYNDTINKLINLLHKITYIPPIKSVDTAIQFHEECIYY
jgi:hypothetical protein